MDINVEMYIEIVWTFISAYLLLSSPVPSTVPSYEPSTGVQYIEVIVDRWSMYTVNIFLYRSVT